MTDPELLDRICSNPRVMVGKPVIRGTRLTVEYILSRLGHGTTFAELLSEYPRLDKMDILACCLFASRSIGDTAYLPNAVLTST